jgi:hypothetical protein
VTRKTSFHWALIILGYLFSYIILTPITGYLTDRFGARYVITICTCILGAILVHSVSGVLRDSTGSYDYSFAINTSDGCSGCLVDMYCKEEHNEYKVFGRVSKRIKSTGLQGRRDVLKGPI